MGSNLGFNFIVNRGGKLVRSLLCSMPNNEASFNGSKLLPTLEKDIVQISKPLLPKASDLLDIKEYMSKAPKIIQENFRDCEVVSAVRFDKDKKLIRMNAGFKYDDINRYEFHSKICCYLDDKDQITQMLRLNDQSKYIDVINFEKGLKQSYSRPNVDALNYYKYHPESIHAELRYGRSIYSGEFQYESSNAIRNLEATFADSSKLSKNDKNRIVYRALQDGITVEEMERLQKAGNVFVEKSFCSTTTDLSVAKRFALGNPILEIDFPKGAEYIDMDKIFNIDRQRWLENEFLLNKGAVFKITNIDKENNIIKAKYLV